MYLDASIHKFKNNISRYIRALESGKVKGVIVYRDKKRVGVLIPLKAKAEDNADQHLQAPRGS